ncbi:hypothetical protein [Mesorhizobium sp. CN2-181]|uniref:hypothetical protein n=1 Tax=Mesorhizobium yinganensis TaxID=3157707 RepID=UPI0032B78380
MTLSCPDSQVISAFDENRLAAWADPVSFRHREQWQRKKLSNAPEIRKLTAPHWQLPVIVGTIDMSSFRHAATVEPD